MSCPDVETLIQGVQAGGLDPETQAHVADCSLCRSRLRIIELIPGALSPSIRVPQRMQERAMAGILAARREELTRPLGTELLTTAGIAALTGLGVLLFSGAGSGGGPLPMLLYAVATGLGAALARSLMGWPLPPEETEGDPAPTAKAGGD